MREPNRGRRRFRSREWWAHGYLPRFWNRRCSPDCMYGADLGAVREHRESCPRAPIYLGIVAKGWWHLWTLREDLWRWSSEVLFAIGGEDNMAQISVMLPILGRFSIGVRVPRSWTKSWVYERREFGVELRGLWPTFLLGFDEQARDMRDYYARKRVEIESGMRLLSTDRYLPPRFSLVPGWRIQSPRVRWLRLQHRIFGKPEFEQTTLKIVEATVTLPEGDYPGAVTFYRERVKRPRWPRAIRDDVYGKFETFGLWMPWPGKGENSYDCGDDGTQSHTEKIGAGGMSEHELDGQDVAKVLAATVAHVLKYRGRYGRVDWKPERVGVMRD